MGVPEHYYVALSAILFTIGVVGVVIRRNPLVIFMSIELMLNAANLALVTFARMHGNGDGQRHQERQASTKGHDSLSTYPTPRTVWIRRDLFPASVLRRR